MGQASRAKRRRAAVRSAQRTRTNTFWYVITGFVVVVGIALIVFARGNEPAEAGPRLASGDRPADHWHAALGVYNCDQWMSDGSGDGVWRWPYATSQGSPGRSATDAYAGLHSHADGIIHMEPAVSEEAGNGATVGKYFDFGGWNISSSGFDFLGTKVSDGDDCNGKPGTLKWATGKYEGSDEITYTEQTGNPGDFKLDDNDIVIVAFVPEDVDVTELGNPPSVTHLPTASQREGQSLDTATTMPPADALTPTTAAGATTTPTTAAGATTTAPQP
jgi:hypothetical protein